MGAELPVEVRRSTRRRRTVSAYEREGRLVVLLPSWMGAEEEKAWVERMRVRVRARQTRGRVSDEDLRRRAEGLSNRYLGGRGRPSSVTWVANQSRRWGSATPADGTVRLSDRLQRMPTWVSDYVLLHELAHLVEPNHGDRFWALLSGYPHLERAKAFLEGVSFAWATSQGEPDVEPPGPGGSPHKTEQEQHS